MRYLVTTTDDSPPFFTNWFAPENHFCVDIGMIVFDLDMPLFTKDGIKWEVIEEDCL